MEKRLFALGLGLALERVRLSLVRLVAYRFIARQLLQRQRVYFGVPASLKCKRSERISQHLDVEKRGKSPNCARLEEVERAQCVFAGRAGGGTKPTSTTPHNAQHAAHGTQRS